MSLAAVGLFAFGLTGSAVVQQTSMNDHLVGSWTFVSAVAEGPSGDKSEPFGPNPNGIIIFARDGHFSLFQSRPELPRIAANDRSKATAGEAKAIVQSVIAYYGTYSLNEADKVISVKIEASTFPNVAGPN